MVEKNWLEQALWKMVEAYVDVSELEALVDDTKYTTFVVNVAHSKDKY